MLPIKVFKKGKKLYKGSSPFTGKDIIDYHRRVLQTTKNICDQRASIYLGPNKKRSKEYFRPGHNRWNEFVLKQDIELLEMNPRRWDVQKIHLLIKKAMKRVPSLKKELRQTPNFGGVIDLIESIVGKSLVKILTYITEIIFGIGITVDEQVERLRTILSKQGEFNLSDKTKYGWTATPSLVRKGKTSLLDYLEHYTHDTKSSRKYNQRLSYFGFDTMFLLLCCSAGYTGYYYPNYKSHHEDAGEEVAIFKTPSTIEWLDPGESFV